MLSSACFFSMRFETFILYVQLRDTVKFDLLRNKDKIYFVYLEILFIKKLFPRCKICRPITACLTKRPTAKGSRSNSIQQILWVAPWRMPRHLANRPFILQHISWKTAIADTSGTTCPRLCHYAFRTDLPFTPYAPGKPP